MVVSSELILVKLRSCRPAIYRFVYTGQLFSMFLCKQTRITENNNRRLDEKNWWIKDKNGSLASSTYLYLKKKIELSLVLPTVVIIIIVVVLLILMCKRKKEHTYTYDYYMFVSNYNIISNTMCIAKKMFGNHELAEVKLEYNVH